MRLVLFNLRYSPNLGDVLLAECLEFGLRAAQPHWDVVALDLTGRRQPGAGSRRRLAALALLQRLPRWLRHRIAKTLLGRSLTRIRPYWSHELATANGVILGGGNLLADADLNFPLKIAAAFAEVARAGATAAVYAVGVSDNWSREGERLFHDAFRGVRLIDVSVRDERSRAIWLRRMGTDGVPTPRVVRDPGLLAAQCHPPLARDSPGARRVGLGVTHPVALRYHADEAMPPPAAFAPWLAELVRALTARGHAVCLFTTGTPEDEAYLTATAPALIAAAAPGGSVTRVPLFGSPGEMAGFISTLDLLLAHRLHACVAAYSYGIAHVGFTWDTKLQSFFESVGRARFLCRAVTTSVPDVVDLAGDALRLGIDPARRLAVLTEVRREIAALADTLATTAGATTAGGPSR
jgi:polysaccharide pyruvyl transferase WcaK-like protein